MVRARGVRATTTMADRVRDLKLLSRERWEAHVAAQGGQADAAVGGATMAPSRPAPMPAPTAGALFNRPNPMNEEGEFVLPYVRSRNKFVDFRGEQHWVDKNGFAIDTPKEGKNWQSNRRYVPVSGKDWTSVKISSVYKYRIPNTSVVNKVGDIKSFLCCGYRLTAAQWIWWLNFLCLIVHTAMIFVTLHFAYWRWDRHPMRDTEHMTIRIYRVTQIPTPYMVENNLTQWAPGWNLTSDQENDGFFLRDNGMPINFASLIIAWFAISAGFHLWACIAGAFERYWFWYWRQMDDAFCWWRWSEYSVSASLMAMAIGITLGIREQNALAAIFMLHWATMAFGFLVEYIAMPKAFVDEKRHAYPIGPDQLDKFRKGEDDYGRTNYYTDPRALKLLSQDQWNQDRPLYDIQNPDLPVAKERRDYFVGSQRTLNYIRRMVPHIFGWFTMSSAWFIIIAHLEWAKADLSLITDRTIPPWVDAAIYGTVIIFVSFGFVQMLFQRLPPGFYFGTELTYCALSLTAKLYLGWFLLLNVIMTDGTVDEALTPAEGTVVSER